MKEEKELLEAYRNAIKALSTLTPGTKEYNSQVIAIANLAKALDNSSKAQDEISREERKLRIEEAKIELEREKLNRNVDLEEKKTKLNNELEEKKLKQSKEIEEAKNQLEVDRQNIEADKVNFDANAKEAAQKFEWVKLGVGIAGGVALGMIGMWEFCKVVTIESDGAVTTLLGKTVVQTALKAAFKK